MSKPFVFQKEEEEKYKNIINNVINTQKQRIIKTFSVSHNDFKVLSDFEKVSLAESGPRGFSYSILKAMSEFVQKHGRGNSQLKISNYVLEEPTPSAHLCHYSRGNTNDGKVFCINIEKVKSYDAVIFHGLKGMWTSGINCYSCVFNKLREKKEK